MSNDIMVRFYEIRRRLKSLHVVTFMGGQFNIEGEGRDGGCILKLSLDSPVVAEDLVKQLEAGLQAYRDYQGKLLEPPPGSTEVMVAGLAEYEGAQEQRAAEAAVPVFEWNEVPGGLAVCYPGRGHELWIRSSGGFTIYDNRTEVLDREPGRSSDLTSAQQAAQDAYLEWAREREAVTA